MSQKCWEVSNLIIGKIELFFLPIFSRNNVVTTFISEKLRQENKHKTEKELYEYLESIDAGAAAQVHPNNRARVQRALEICLLSNGNKKDKVQDQKKLRFDKTALFILDAETNVLDERLDKRVDKMQNKGLMKELTEFYEKVSSFAFDFLIFSTNPLLVLMELSNRLESRNSSLFLISEKKSILHGNMRNSSNIVLVNSS